MFDKEIFWKIGCPLAQSALMDLLMILFCTSQPSHATCRVQHQIKSFRAVELALEAEEMVDEARPLVYPE